MGMLLDGKWQDVGYDTKSSGGRFVRNESAFRSRIAADGSTEFRRRWTATTCTCRSPARGRTARWCSGR